MSINRILKMVISAVCIDIGTTTVAFELVTDKGTLKTYRTINPQRRFGLDVLSKNRVGKQRKVGRAFGCYALYDYKQGNKK